MLKTPALSQTPIAPDRAAVGEAPPPLKLDVLVGFDVVTAVPVVPLLLADLPLPRLSGTPVGGAASVVVGVAVEPFGPVGAGPTTVGVRVAPEASVTVGTLSVIPLCAQFCAKPVPMQNQTGDQDKNRVDRSTSRAERRDEGGRTKPENENNSTE
jgi:hypothetical protein